MSPHNLAPYVAVDPAGTWRSLIDGTTTGGGGGGTKTMLIGASQRDWDNFNTTLRAGGGNGLKVRRSYDTGTTPASFAASAASGDHSRGVTSYWSCSGETVATIASGNAARLTAISNFAASVPADQKMYITYWHEADLNNKGGSFTAAQMQTAQALIHTTIKAAAVNPGNILVGPLLTASGYGFNGNDAGIANWFPTSSADYDFCGIDGYDFLRPSTNPLPTDPTNTTALKSPTTTYWTPPVDPSIGNYGRLRPPAYSMKSALTFANAHGKKLVVGEYSAHPFPTNPSYFSSPGVADILSRPYRVQQMIDYHDNNGSLAFCFFHSDAGGRGPWWMDAFHQFQGSTGAVSGHPLSDVDDSDHTTYPDSSTMAQLLSILSVRV